MFAGIVRGNLVNDPGYRAVLTIPGIGPTLGAVFVAEIGDVTRFARAEQLACWAGLTPKHHESDTHVHRGRITKQGSRLIRWAAIESVQILPKTSVVGRTGNASEPDAAITSASSPPPGSNSSTSSTRCAITTSARWRTTARPRRDPRPAQSLAGAGRAGHDPRLRRGRAF